MNIPVSVIAHVAVIDRIRDAQSSFFYLSSNVSAE